MDDEITQITTDMCEYNTSKANKELRAEATPMWNVQWRVEGEKHTEDKFFPHSHLQNFRHLQQNTITDLQDPEISGLGIHVQVENKN